MKYLVGQIIFSFQFRVVDMDETTVDSIGVIWISYLDCDDPFMAIDDPLYVGVASDSFVTAHNTYNVCTSNSVIRLATAVQVDRGIGRSHGARRSRGLPQDYFLILVQGIPVHRSKFAFVGDLQCCTGVVGITHARLQPQKKGLGCSHCKWRENYWRNPLGESCKWALQV